MLQPTPSDPNPAETAETRALRPKLGAPALELDPALRAGDKLAEARRQLGLSLEEVAERIRVRREFLEALEAMNIKLLPGKAYALAFLRSYARALGMDENAIVEQFQDESALTREDAQKQIRNPTSKPNARRPWLVAAIVLVATAGFVAWRALQHEEALSPGQQIVRADAIAPSQKAPAQPNGVHAGTVEIKALADAWLEARGPDGTVFLSRTLNAGDVYRPDPSPGWTLHARDGAAFEVYVNGISAGPLGAAGMPVLGRPIDGIQPLNQAALQAPRS